MEIKFELELVLSTLHALSCIFKTNPSEKQITQGKVFKI